MPFPIAQDWTFAASFQNLRSKNSNDGFSVLDHSDPFHYERNTPAPGRQSLPAPKRRLHGLVSAQDETIPDGRDWTKVLNAFPSPPLTPPSALGASHSRSISSGAGRLPQLVEQSLSFNDAEEVCVYDEEGVDLPYGRSTESADARRNEVQKLTDALREMENRCLEKDGEVKGMRGSIRVKDAEIRHLTEEIEEKTATHLGTVAQVARLETKIGVKDAEMERLKTSMNQWQASWGRSEERILELEAETSQRDARIYELLRTLARLKKDFEELDRCYVAKRDEAEMLTVDCKAKDDHILELTRRVEELEEQRDDSNHRYLEKEAEVEALKATMGAQDVQLDEITQNVLQATARLSGEYDEAARLEEEAEPLEGDEPLTLDDLLKQFAQDADIESQVNEMRLEWDDERERLMSERRAIEASEALLKQKMHDLEIALEAERAFFEEERRIRRHAEQEESERMAREWEEERYKLRRQFEADIEWVLEREVRERALIASEGTSKIRRAEKQKEKMEQRVNILEGRVERLQHRCSQIEGERAELERVHRHTVDAIYMERVKANARVKSLETEIQDVRSENGVYAL